MKSAGRPASKWYDRSGCRDFSQGIVMYYCAGGIRHWQPLSNLLERGRGEQSLAGEFGSGGYEQESTYVQSISMATRRRSNSLSNFGPRLGHPGHLLFQSAVGLGAPGAGAVFFDLRCLGSLGLAYAAEDCGL